jgi:hypothetical protein
VVLAERGRIRLLSELVEHPRRALDIGEQGRDGSDGVPVIG